MTRKEKADRIGEILDGLYPDPPLPLDHRNTFTLLVAVLLSAQTTDAMVNRVTPELFERAATPTEMASLSVDEILAAIRRVGLAPTKARNVKRLSEILVEEHGGEVPRSLTTLETLPGVGHKTASAVAVQAFGIPAFPVDTHIHRLADRWGLSNGSNVTRTEADLKRVFPEETWGRRHLQIIYFGRQHCPARGHDLEACRICSWAASARRKREEARRPAARRR